MRTRHLAVVCVGTLLACAALVRTRDARAAETVIDDFESAASPSPWTFYDGSEFPGGVGSLTSGAGRAGKGAHLAYDFAAGGRYVSATLTLTSPMNAVAVTYRARAPAGIRPKLRVLDSSGQTLQYDVSRPLEGADPASWFREVVQLDAPSSHYGGTNDGAVHQPIVALTLMAADPLEPSASGAVDFDDVTALDTLAPGLDPDAALLPAPAGSEDLASRMAVNIHFTTDDRALDIAEAAGFSVVRMDLGWAGVERTKGAYDFTAVDALVTALDARSMRLHLILDYFDAIYPGADSPDFAAITVPAFAAMSRAAAAHFAGRNVTYEIWNEPNLAGFWPPAPSAARYAALSAAAIAAVHEGDPAAKVSTAGISGFDFAFLRDYLAAGGAAGADAIGVHPYRQGPPESVVEDLALMRDVVRGAVSPAPAPPSWDTEWGYSSAWYGDGHAESTRKKQAVFAVRELLSAWAVGFPLAVYYDLRDDGTDPSNGEHNFGLVQNDYTDKPAAVGVRTLSAAARGRTFTGFAALEPSSLHAMRLDGADGSRTFVVWSGAPDASLPIALAGAPAVTDAFGAAVPLENVTGAGSSITAREADGPLYVAYPAPPSADGGSASGGASAANGGASGTGNASNAGGSTGSTGAGGSRGAPGGATSAGGTGARGGGDGGTVDSGATPGDRSSDPSGCGCRTASAGHDEKAAAWLLLLLVAAALGRSAGSSGRRRRERPTLPS